MKIMKKSYNEKSGTFNLMYLSGVEYETLCKVLSTANNRCFEDCESDGMWYSNDDFMCTLDNDEREALRKLCEEF